MGELSHRWDLFEDAPELVKSRFDDMKSFGQEGYNMAMSAIQLLSEILSGLAMIDKIIQIDTFPIDGALGEVPDPPTVDANEFRIDYPTTPTEPTLIDAQMGTLPTGFPELQGPGEVSTGDLTYWSDLMDALQTKIMSDLQSWGTGVPKWVEDALQARNFERDLAEYEDEQDRVAANWSRGGFPFPNGGLRAAQDKVTREFSNKRLDVSRDIMFKSWDYAYQNYHFIIQSALGIETLFIRWAENVANRVLEASKAAIDANIKSYEARLKGFSEEVKIVIDTCMAKIQYNVALIKQYEASVNAFSAKMAAEGQRVNAVARSYEAQVSVFGSIVDYEVKKVDLSLKVIQAKIDQAVANAQIQLKDKEIEIKEYEALNSLKAEAQKAIGAIASQVAAGALSAVHAQVQIAAQDSATYSARSGELLLTDDLP